VNRLLFTLLFLFSVLGVGWAQQDFENCAQVISTSGKFAQRAGKVFFYTVGEPVILTLKNPRYALTQGFHQPDLCVSVSTRDLRLADWQIEVFPNPTADFVTFRFDETQGNTLELSVWNLLGQNILTNYSLNNPQGTTLDCTQWQSGVYIATLRDPKTDSSASIRLVRL
jgi:hypothetical protein